MPIFLEIRHLPEKPLLDIRDLKWDNIKFCQRMDPAKCHRPMKLWEFEAVSRWSSVSIDSLVHSKEWNEPFGRYLDDFEALANVQDRDILDMPVPIELSRAACELYSDLVFAVDSLGNVRLLTHSCSEPPGLSATFIHDEFGGAVIEDVLEKGSFRLPDALVQQRAEQGADAKPDNVTS